MKKHIALFFGLISCFGIASCNNEEPKPDFDITAVFSFYKDGDKRERFETSEFEINTKIYVCVDFSIQKNVDAEEVIDFEVQIPYAEYYSTKDFYSGTIRPHEDLRTRQDSYGNEYTVMYLNQMSFLLDDKENHEYHYIFEIEANQPCESAEFIVRFIPENSNIHNVEVNSIKDNKAKTLYTFIEKEN